MKTNNIVDISKRTKGELKMRNSKYELQIETTTANYSGNTIAILNPDNDNKESDAAFIVLACNNFYKLVETLKNLVNEYDGIVFRDESKMESAKQLLQSIEQQTM